MDQNDQEQMAQDFFDAAEGLRIGGDPQAACRAYEQASMFTDDPHLLRRCAHMAGACYTDIDMVPHALECFERALNGAGTFDRAIVLRDKARAFMKADMLDDAQVCLDESAQLLLGIRNLEQLAATLGFMARLEQQKGRPIQAIRFFGMASGELAWDNNPHYALYNNLSFAVCLSENGNRFWARLYAFSAFVGARRHYGQQRVGAPMHQARALALIVGGHRLDKRLTAAHKWLQRHRR